MARVRNPDLRNDSRLDVSNTIVPGAIHHASQHVIEVRQRSAPRDVLAALEPAALNQVEGASRRSRRVMKAGLQRYIAVMQAVCIQLNLRSCRRTAEEI